MKHYIILIKLLWALSVALTLPAMGGPRAAGSADGFGLVELRREPTRSDIKHIRVKIFPHSHDFAPHKKDPFNDRFVIVSPANCVVSPVEHPHAIPAAPSPRIITKAARIPLHVASLRQPILVDCPQGFTLQRAGLDKKASFMYRGLLVVVAKKDKTTGRPYLAAINTIDLEQYLRGVVPVEVMAGWPMETLKSQAVAARTYAVYHMLHARLVRQGALFDVDDTVFYQAYTGVSSEHERTNAAVDATVGEIIVFGERIMPAYYHADSGGVIASCRQISNLEKSTTPYCGSRNEPSAIHASSSRWRRLLTIDEINLRLIAKNYVSPTNRAVGIAVPGGQSEAQRVEHLHLALSDGSAKKLAVAEFKRAVNLDSNLFAIRQLQIGETRHFEFIGRGSGHGVGMNQQGARFFAESYNWSYDKILHYYYSGQRFSL